MKRFEKLSIREKLIRVILLTTAAVLLPMAAVLVVVYFFLLRQSTARVLVTLAEAVAYNSSAALAFDNRADAVGILEAFRTDPHVTTAILYDS